MAEPVPRIALKEIIDDAALTVPWELRPVADNSSRHQSSSSLRILSSPYLWWKLLYSLRMSAVAMLPIASLIAADATMDGFVSKSYATSGALISCKETLGASVHATVEWLKSVFLALPIATVLIYMEVYKNGYAWGSVYVFVLTFFAFLSDGLTRRLGLLLINVAMVAELRGYYDGKGKGLDPVFPARLAAEYTMGCVTGILASLIPFPKLAGRRVDKKTAEAAQNLSLCFSGLCNSFWTSSNLQRRINMARIHYAQKTALANLDDVKACMNECRFEPQSLDQYFLRVAKYDLLSSYSPIVDSALRVLETVSEDPIIVSGSEQAASFGITLDPSLKELASAVDASLNLVANAKSRRDFIILNAPEWEDLGMHVEMQSLQGGQEHLKQQHPIRRVQLAVLHFEAAFTLARKNIYYTVKREGTNNSEHKVSTMRRRRSTTNNNGDDANQRASTIDLDSNVDMPMSPTSPQILNTAFYTGTGYDMAPAAQEFAALMAFYIFTLSQFAKKTLSFPDTIESKRRGKAFWKCVWAEIWESVSSSFLIFWELLAFVFCIPSVEPQKALNAAIKLRESAKLSIAMGLSVLFFHYTDRPFAYLSGPSILTFVASNTSSEALNGSMVRLFGTLFGGVIGFFAAEITYTPTEKVAALIVIMFFFAFFRTGKQYGVAAVYACFVVVPMLSPIVKSDEAIARITQITFAAMIYTIIMIFVFPTRPMPELANSRILAMSSMSKALASVMKAFNAPFVAGGSASGAPSRSISAVNRREEEGGTSSSEEIDPWELEKVRDPAAASQPVRKNTEDFVRNKTMSAIVASGGEVTTSPNPQRNVSKTEGSKLPFHDMYNRVSSLSHRSHGLHHSIHIQDSLTLNTSLAIPEAPIPPEDKLLLAAASSVKALDKLVTHAGSWVPLAETEPTLTRVAFPTTANKEFHTTMVRMRSLLDLMVEALKALRTQRTEPPSPYFMAVLDDLHPLTLRCTERFRLVVNMIVMTLNRRHAGLASEMVRTSLSLEEDCIALHYQKSLSFQQLVKLGRIIYDKQLRLRRARHDGEGGILPARRVEDHRSDSFENIGLLEAVHPSGGSKESLAVPVSPAVSQSAISDPIGAMSNLDLLVASSRKAAALHQLHLGFPKDDVKNSSALLPPVIAQSSQGTRDKLPSQVSSVSKFENGRFVTPVSAWTVLELDHLANLIINSGGHSAVVSPTTPEPLTNDTMCYPSHHPAAPTQGLDTCDGAKSEHNSVGTHQAQAHARKLKMLMTNADAEGMHTFTFCLVIFSKEIKRLVMAVETLQQHMIAAE